MEIKGVKIEPVKEINIVAYECPYCSKKMFNKNSYYKYISKNYCWSFNYKFQELTNKYNDKEITYQEYLTQCYENGVIDYLNIDDIKRDELSKEFYKKICDLYDY